MKHFTWLAFALVVFLATVLISCGAGVSSDDSSGDEDNQATVGMLSGTISYDGPATGGAVVIGLIEQWPMTGPPKEFESVAVPDGGFPFQYSINIKYTGPFYLAAFLDVHPTDGVMMNCGLDPMAVPGEQKINLVAGDNTYDFHLLDPGDPGYPTCSKQ